MKLKSLSTAILAISITFTYAQEHIALIKNQAAKLQEKKQKAFVALGNWRGIAKVKEGLEIPFNFEISEKSGQQKLYCLLYTSPSPRDRG